MPLLKNARDLLVRVICYFRTSMTWRSLRSMGGSCLLASWTKRGYITPITKIHPPSFPQILPTSHITRQATSFYTHTQVVVRHRVERTSACDGAAAQAASTCPLMVQIQCAAELCFLLCGGKHPWQNKKESSVLQRQLFVVKTQDSLKKDFYKRNRCNVFSSKYSES